ncbi:MAG TPA: DUF2357 domain-containing protein, partial [Paracoccus solventivorans]|uniref:DUF2357 domain-containing protein n=1 Tax=Paracoccus solventivorans TaxID=53463 RepID=UPI002B9376F8
MSAAQHRHLGLAHAGADRGPGLARRRHIGAARQFAQGLGSLRRQSWWKSVPEPQRRQLDLLGGALRRFNEDPKFAEVGAFGRPPSSSRVLLRKDGYRDLFALWGAYQRARRPLFAA